MTDAKGKPLIEFEATDDRLEISVYGSDDNHDVTVVTTLPIIETDRLLQWLIQTKKMREVVNEG